MGFQHPGPETPPDLRFTTCLQRPRGWRKEERRKEKILKKSSWYRPADVVGFYPASPRGELASEIKKILCEEGKRINMDLRLRETGGPSLARLLVKPDLKAGEPCGRPGCVLDQLSGGQGGPHNKASALYHGVCKLCGECGEKHHSLATIDH